MRPPGERPALQLQGDAGGPSAGSLLDRNHAWICLTRQDLPSGAARSIRTRVTASFVCRTLPSAPIGSAAPGGTACATIALGSHARGMSTESHSPSSSPGRSHAETPGSLRAASLSKTPWHRAT